MSMRRSILPLVTATVAACQPGAPELDTRTFGLQHLDGGTAEVILMPYVYTDRETSPGMMTAAAGAVTIRETPDNLARIERVLEEMDRAAPEVLLRFQVIEANGPGEPDPAIADVEAELRELFRFEGYRLVGEAVVSPGQSGSFQTSVLGADDGWRIVGNRVEGGTRVGSFAGGDRPGSSSAGRRIRLDDIMLLRESGLGEVALRSSVTVRPGQTLVLGSARPEGEGRGAIILTVHAEVANP